MSKAVRPPMGRFGMIPSAAYIDTRVSSLMRDILGIISTHGNTKAAGWCYLYQRTISELLGISRQWVNLQVGKLTEYGYLEKKPTFLKNGTRTYNWYRVNLNYDLPAQFSRLPVAPDDERPDEDPPVNSKRHTLSTGVDNPVNSSGQPCQVPLTTFNKDERGKLNGENLTGVTDSPPVLENLPSGDGELTREQIRAWPWLYGVPVRSRGLRTWHVERSTNAYEALLRQDIADGRVPERDTWERAHHWPRGAMPRSSEREREYRRFAAIVGARIAEMHTAAIGELALVE